MTTLTLFRAIGQISDDKIIEADKTIHKNTRRIVQNKWIPLTVAACLVITITTILFTMLIPNTHPSYNITFNKVGGLMQGAPAFREDAFHEKITLLEAEAILGVDIRDSLPESLSDFEFFVMAGYFLPKELYQLDTIIHQTRVAPGFGKTIVISNASQSWSEHSVSSIDYAFANQSSNEISLVYDIEILFKTHGIFGEPTYIAEFELSDIYYHVEGRGGIEEEEFIEFITKLIGSYANYSN